MSQPITIDDVTTGRRNLADTDFEVVSDDQSLRGVMVDDLTTGRRQATSIADLWTYGSSEMIDNLTNGRRPLS